jgi:hypothetical protein
MAGTASTLTEYANPAERLPEQQQCLIDRLSDWLFGQNDMVYRNCVLAKISADGGEILIAKDMIIPGSIFDVVIHDPDNANKTSVIIRAELLWSDIEHSQAHIKIGFGFANNSLSTRRAVKNLVDHAARKDTMNYDCSLIF